MIDVTGQVAIITGAGRGLGRLYALDLAKRGAAVVVNDLGSTMRGHGVDGAVADSVVDEITSAGGRAVASYDSVDTAEGGAAIVDTAVSSFGRLDTIISNAGIFGSVAFEDLSHDDWTRMLRVHLDGGFHLSQPAYRVMKTGGGAGRYARAFVGLREGWLADADLEPAAEDIAAHLDQISATEKFIVPTSIVDEVLEVCDRIGVSAMPGGAEVAFPERA